MDMIINLVLKVLGWCLDRQAADDEAKRAYLAFVEIMNKKAISSVSLRTSYQEQLKKLRDEGKP